MKIKKCMKQKSIPMNQELYIYVYVYIYTYTALDLKNIFSADF